MKIVTDFPAFAETARLLSDLTNERDQLEIELSTLREQLVKGITNPQSMSTEELARTLADGGDIPATGGNHRRLASEHELVVRSRLESVNKLLPDLAQLLEHRRQQARAAALQEMAGDLEAVKRDFEKARTAMLAAVLQESRLIDRLIVGGFGGGDPQLTAPIWLNRGLLIEGG